MRVTGTVARAIRPGPSGDVYVGSVAAPVCHFQGLLDAFGVAFLGELLNLAGRRPQRGGGGPFCSPENCSYFDLARQGLDAYLSRPFLSGTICNYAEQADEKSH